MIARVTQSLLILAVAVALSPTPARAQVSLQDELLATGKATLVSEVEPGLPAIPFEARMSFPAASVNPRVRMRGTI